MPGGLIPIIICIIPNGNMPKKIKKKKRQGTELHSILEVC